MSKIAIVDYGLSNLLSVRRAFDMFSKDVLVTNNIDEICSASKIVLPGVGAFDDGMEGLQKYGLNEILVSCGKKKIPILGICLGMQMLFDKSFENGEHEGLGLIPGIVERIPDNTLEGKKQCVPQIGWSSLNCPGLDDYFSNNLLADIMPGSDVYFIHSYECKPYLSEDVIAYTYYGGREVCAVVAHDSIYGCQFHPEKSGKVGLKIIKNFCML